MASISISINSLANKSKALDRVGIFLAKYLIYLLILFLFLSAFVYRNRDIFSYPLLSGLFAAFIINSLIYLFFKAKRPSEFEGTKVLIAVPGNPSFPSRHAAITFGMAFCLFFYNIPLAIIFTFCAVLVSMSRVFCGVHWVKDIFAGMFTGLLSVLLVQGLLNLIK